MARERDWMTRNPVGTPVEVHCGGEWILGSVIGYAPGHLTVRLSSDARGERFTFAVSEESKVRFLNYETGLRKAMEIVRELGARIHIASGYFDAVEAEIEKELRRVKKV